MKSNSSAQSPVVRTKNIVISGTNFWNPGDDFVRDGIIRILREIFPDEVLNFLFYNFNADFFPQDKFSGIGNYIAKGDLEKYRDFVDAVVIAGLSAGDEIKDLYDWVVTNGLEEKVYLIGAGYENDYVAKHISQEPEATIFRHARLVTGRTSKTPDFIRDAGIPYHHINCPAILSVPEVKKIPAGKKIGRIGFSIQLPHGEGLANHSCARGQYELSVAMLRELSRQYEVEVIAHHKTEYFHFLNLLRDENIPVIFSSFYQDLHKIYPRYDLVVTTRLHSSLFANGHGIPGIIVNDTDRHTHTLDGFSHSIWVNNREKFDQAFARWNSSDLAAISSELENFKAGLLAKYITVLRPAMAGVENQIAENFPAVENLPIHFFTIVLNGLPFIRHHIDQLRRLPFRWHWHVIEGVADLKHDTAWSLETGGQIPAAAHRNGLSQDGTTEYLDRLAGENPNRISIYRKSGALWNGKLEMVNAPLKNIREECLLWQMDADELWTAEPIIRARSLFLAQPEKTAALFRCHYFVGPELVVTSRDTYGNRNDEWLRIWRYRPEDKWISHEPPKLVRHNDMGEELDVAINPFTQDETKAEGLVFDHYAYASEGQVRFKEDYYGYKNAVAQWRQLQTAKIFPVALSDYFAWVDDDAMVDTIQSCGIRPVARAQWFSNGFISSIPHNQFNSVMLARRLEYGKGVHPQEGTIRWVANHGEIRLPNQFLSGPVNLTFSLSAGDLWCYGRQLFQTLISLDGKPLRRVSFNQNGQKFEITIRLEPKPVAQLLTLESSTSFVPAQIDRNSRDQRQLAVKFFGLSIVEISKTPAARSEP